MILNFSAFVSPYIFGSMSKNSMTDETAYLYSNYNIVFLKDNSIEDLLNIKIWINYIENINKI
ncbi:hypothetical protein F240042I4_51020 [Eisenbergiella tayi]